MKNYIIAVVLLLSLVAFGCVNQQPQPIVGGDKDAFGCIPSAGYSWCDAKQKCIRAWEENCTSVTEPAKTAPVTQIANPASVNCEQKGGTLKIEDTSTGQVGMCTLKTGEVCEEWAYYRGECPVLTPEEQAKKFCGTENVREVSLCGDTIRVYSSLIGGGSTFYRNGKEIEQCPVVAPTYVTEQCKALILGDKCFEKKVC